MARRDYSERLKIAAEQSTKERDFWLKELSGELVKSHFRYDYKKTGIDCGRVEADSDPVSIIDSIPFECSEEISVKLMELSRGADRALNLVLIAGVILLLHKYTGSKDILVGTPIYKQESEEDFINTALVLRTPVECRLTFKEFLLQVRQTITGAIENQNYPIELLNEKLDLDVDSFDESESLFDVAVLLENIHDKKYLRQVSCSLLFSFRKETRADGSRHITGIVDYNTLLYEKVTVERLVGHFMNLMQTSLYNLNEPLSQLEMLTDREKKQLLYNFNATKTGYPAGKTIHRWFEEQVEKTPDKPAVCSPIDLDGIFDWLEFGKSAFDLGKRMETCLFKNNPYIHSAHLELPLSDTGLKLLKTHHHNSVLVNNNTAELIMLFDGKRNVKNIYLQFKALEEQGVEFLIHSMSMTDLLEVSFRFKPRPEIFTVRGFEDLLLLVRVLYRERLIHLAGLDGPVPGLRSGEPPVWGFKKEESPGLKMGDIWSKHKEAPRARVLLLGDTPGTPSTGLLYLGSYLKRKGIPALCRFYDPGTDYASMKENIVALLEEVQPGIVAVSLKWFLYIARVIDMCKMVKEYAAEHSLDIKVVVGGNTASYYRREIITHDCIDYVIRGDGEEPLWKICLGEKEENIPNCIYKRNGEVVENPVTYLQDESNSREIYLSHLDELLLSDYYSLLGSFFIYTHKGCVMNCLYCGGCSRAQEETYNRKKVFRRGVEEVRQDILAARKYASSFQFDFDIPDNNLVVYCKQIWEGIDLSAHFCIFATLTPPSADLIALVAGSFRYVYWDFDICSLSERHRKQLFTLGLVKPQPSDRQILEFMAQCEVYSNIEVRPNLITGLPYFTPEDIEPGEKLLAGIMHTYSCFGELHWARLHAQPGAPILEDPGIYGMHSYASEFEEFQEYSRKNFNRSSGYTAVENIDYPYIYFNDDRLNSSITNFYLESNRKIEQFKAEKRRRLIVPDTLTYRQLDDKARNLAGMLGAGGVRPGEIVALLLDRSLHVPVGILGVLKTGCAYLPIDSGTPEGRIGYILKDSSAAALVTRAGEGGNVRKWGGKIFFLEDRGGEKGEAPSPSVLSHAGPLDPVYVIYTSGTTGKPKGVLLKHENLANYVHWFTKTANLTEKDKTILTSSYAFDLGYTSLYSSLLNGCELHILPREDYLLAERLLDYIRQRAVTYLKVTPSLFAAIVNSPGFSMETCKTLRLAAVGGEAINTADIEKAHSICSRLRVMNHYGPTEATIGCVATFIDFSRFDDYKKHPVIGRPIANTQVYILAENSVLLPVGVPGELCIAGSGLASGYLNRPDLTAEKFPPAGSPSLITPSPSLTSGGPPAPSAPLYRTGDRARRLPDGTIEFLGRIDNQVKVRGYRIELGEIENRLLKHPRVKDALVVVKDPPESGESSANVNDNKYICAYIIPKGGKVGTPVREKAAGIKKVLKLSEIAKEGGLVSPGEDTRHTESGLESPSIFYRFQEQVKKNQGKTALTSNGRSLTYLSLDRYADRVAHAVRENYENGYKLSKNERTRYQRQMLLHDWGMESQEKLKGTTVFVAGAGGGASPTITQLALVGVGTIILCDFDDVELSNLNRQFLHDEERLGMNKALSAQITINKLNPNVKVIPYTGKLTRENVFEMVGDSDIIFDMFDGPADKFVLSECAVAKGIPHVIISMTDINAYTTVCHTPRTPCFHCLFDRKKLETIVSGMKHHVKNYSKNPLPVVATSLFISTGTAVNEALKILLGFKEPAYNKFFYFNQRGEEENLVYTPGYKAMTHLFSDHFLQGCKDRGFDWDTGWRGRYMEELEITPDPHCPLCSAEGRELRESLEEKMNQPEVKEETTTGGEIQTAALLLDHGIDEVAAALGVLKAGKTYVPLSPSLPLEQLAHIVEDSESRIILTENDFLPLAEKLRDRVNKNIKTVNISNIAGPEGDESAVNPDAGSLDTVLNPEQAAYILYPPVSTEPGGTGTDAVMESHPDVLDFVSTYTYNVRRHTGGMERFDALSADGRYSLNTGMADIFSVLLDGAGEFNFEIHRPDEKPGAFTEFREYLREELPDYMIPSYFVPLEAVPLTPNGKVDMRALPEPDVLDEAGDYVPPRNELEKKLVEIWADVLQKDEESLGINANFFELGGHSLNATILISKIHKELNARVPLEKFFQIPRIIDLSSYIKNLTEDKYSAIEPVEKREYYALSSAQKRLYVLQEMESENTSYNIPLFIPLDNTVTKEKLEDTFLKLIRRHENLRTSFETVNKKKVQRIHPEVEFAVEDTDIDSIVRPFQLDRAPLMRAGLITDEQGRRLLIVDIHHIISDGTSHDILQNDFMAFFAGEEPGPLRLQYRDFSSWQNGLFSSGKIREQEQYWLNLYSGEVPCLNLPVDYARPATFSFKGDVYDFTIDKEDLMPFKTLNTKYGATLFMNLLAAFNVLLFKYTGQDDIVVGTGISGRPHADLQGVLGMFVNMLPLRNFPGGDSVYIEFLGEVKKNSLKAFENQDVQFEELVDKLELEREPSRNPLFDVTLVVQNYTKETSRENDIPIVVPSSFTLEHGTSKFDMTLFVWEAGDELRCTLEYYTGIFARQTIERFVKHFLNIIRRVGKNPGIKLSEIDIVGEEEKKRLLFDFNKTSTLYPEEKTIHQLFEEQVEKTPDRMALVFEDESLSYRHLDEKANQLAQYLFFEKQVRPETAIGILQDRSLYQVIAVLGILKAGGAYLPLDVAQPEVRIKNMIADAGVEIVISTAKCIRLLNRLQWECKSFHTFLCLDSDDIHREEEVEKSSLMDEKLWDYVADSAADEITGGGWFTSYTGEPFSKEEMAEYGDNVLKKLTPLFHEKMKVLEIGCGSGLTMYPAAARVRRYYGTDLSHSIIEMNERRVEQEGHRNIVLTALPAHEIEKIGEGDFDLVIINSVVQSFHGHNYLVNVIRKAIDLLGDNGYLFIGDVLDQELKETLIREMTEFRYGNSKGSSKTKIDWSEDLFVSRSFFEDLAVEFPVVGRVEFSGKIFTIENELTKFRYDTLITVDKCNKEKTGNRARQKYQHDMNALMKFPGTKVETNVEPGGLAYVIYTSGSTGKSRGVMVEHGNVLRLVKNSNYIDRINFTEGDRFLLTGAFAFDISTFEIWGLLLNGLSLYMVDKNDLIDVERLRETVVRNRISVIHFIPQLFKEVVDHCPGVFEGIKCLLVGGDVVRPAAVNRLRNQYPNLEILHMYGPTENTTFSTFFPIDKDYPTHIPIGKPVSNSTVYILDKYDRLQPIGVPGELCLGGKGLARGYLNLAQPTAEKFSRGSAPLIPYLLPLTPLYRTGDLGRWLPDGNIEFAGRMDYQVKVRGFRVELGEIESRLMRKKDIKEAVVLAKEDQSGDRRLYAYIVSDKEFEVSEIRDYLAEYLPDYMIPSYFIPLESIPLNPNGKINRKALPDPEVKIGEEYIAPRDKIETTLVEIWSDVLNIEIESMGIDVNFFELGGHSLKATTLAARMHKELNIKIPLVDIFKNQTVRALATHIRGGVLDKHVVIDPVEKKEFYPLSSAQKRLYYLQQMDLTATAYNMPHILTFEKEMDREKLEAAFKKLIARHESLRTAFEIVDEGPVQRIHEDVDFIIEYYEPNRDSGPGPLQPPGKMLNHFIKPFDLSQAPLVRVVLLTPGDGTQVMIIDMHHIVTDGTSQTILTTEFGAIIAGEDLPPLAIHYKDYSEWQRQRVMEGAFKPQEEFWLKKLEGDPPVLNLPLDYPRPAVQDFEGREIGFHLSNEETKKLNEFARRENTTLFMVLLAGVNVFLSKVCSREDVVVGSPIAGRAHADLEKVIGMFINTLALRNYPSGEKKIESFFKEVKEKTLEAFENQDYQFENLVEKVVPRMDMSRNPVFDVMFALQNIQEIPANTGELEKETAGSAPYALAYENRTSIFDLMITAYEVGETLHFTFQYCTKLFREATVLGFIEYFRKVITSILEDPGREIATIEIISEEEKHRVLFEFNNTGTAYPKSNVIHRLFEKQAEKTPDNIAVTGIGGHHNQVTYKELETISNQLSHQLRMKGIKPEAIVGILVVNRSIEMMVGILAILKAGGAYLPVDPEYPEERIKYMLHDSNASLLLTQSGLPGPDGFQGKSVELDDRSLYSGNRQPPDNINTPGDLAYVMYTSGSTGKAKGVLVEHRGVIRLVVNTGYIALTGETRLLQTGAPVFDATTFEMWGTLLNGGGLFLVENEVILNAGRLGRAMVKNRINTMWLTSPLFNLLAHENPHIFSPLHHLIVGGDVLSPKTINMVRHANKKLKIINGYGPTENTTFSTTFSIERDFEESIPIGGPISNSTAFILDKNDLLQPIGIFGRLCVGGDGVARGYLNGPELTKEKIGDDPFLEGERLYRTGDIARWLPDGNIEFAGRMDEQVKIRGFRIELGEIETRLLNYQGIEEAVIISKKAETGDKFLCAYIVSHRVIRESDLREYMLNSLPGYMVPQYFVFLEQIPLTPNGKVDRRALPRPGIKEREENTYIAPRDEMEEKLVEIWAGALELETDIIGIDSNFFELGGHSLKVAAVVSKIHKALDLKLEVTEVFTNPTVRELAEIVKTLTENKYTALEPAEKKEYYPLSSAQRRLYILQQMETGLTSYNMPNILPLAEEIDKEKLENVFKTLIARHESLRTSYRMVHEEPVQKIHEYVKFKIDYYEGDRGEGIVQDFVRPFDLARAPILRVGVTGVESSFRRLLIDMHHIITDGISQGILTNEFMTLYAGEELPPLRLRYIDYSEWQNSDSQKEAVKQQENYWLKQYEGDIPVLNMYTDYPRPAIQSFEGSIVDFELNREETKALNDIARADGATLFMVLLAVFNIFLSKLSRQEDIVAGTPVAGRNHADLEHIIGMFVNTLPLRNFPSGEKEFTVFLLEVKEKTLEAFENHDYHFEDLVEKVNAAKDMSRNPLFDVMFAFQDLGDAPDRTIEKDAEEETDKSFGYKQRTSKFDLSLSVIHKGEKLSCVFEYCTKLFKEESIVRFKKYFKQIISSVAAAPGKKISGIEIISEEEKKQVLVDFNNTGSDYPKDITIHRLFERQETKTPHRIAIQGDNDSLSYRELNKKSSQLAHLLRTRGVKADSIVGIMVERSIEMPVGILAILKAGGAYLPIVPDYPPDRISFMLEDSDARAVLTQKPFLNIVKDNIEAIDLETPQFDEEKIETLNDTENITGNSSANAGDLAYLIYTSGSTGKPKGVMVEHRSSMNTLFALHEKYPFLESDNYLLKTSFIFDVSTAELFGWFLGGGRLVILEKNGEKDPYKILDTIKNAGITHINFVPSMFSVFTGILNSQNIKKLTGLKYIFLAGEALLPELVNKFRKLNTKVAVENIYGPTEAAVYASSYPLSQWEGKGSIPIGKPMPNVRLYILNKENRLQPIGVPGELCIGGEGVAKGYLNRPELTAEKFSRGAASLTPYPLPPILTPFYRTGDLACWFPDGNIAFLGRIDAQVKLRGFRIEPGEIENRLIDHEDIKEAVVIEIRENREDNHLAAYIVSENPVEVSQIKEYLSVKLPYYMVPTYYMRVDEIPLTPSGKIDRKALPEPRIKTGVGFVAPRNEVEEKLAEIWSEVLRLEKDLIGIDSNFFELKGHSLKATVMTAKVHKELNVKIPLSDVFKAPTIRGLSERVKGLTEDKYASIEPAEKKEYYTSSSGQKRLYIEQQIDFNSTRYNTTQYLSIEGELKRKNLTEAFRQLIQRHESLRTSFDTIGEELVQRIHEDADFIVEYQNAVQGESGEGRGKKIGLKILLQDFRKPFDLSKAPLLRVGLLKVETGNHILMVDMHHIINDEISNGILTRDFLSLYNGGQLPPLKLQYKDYSEWQNSDPQEESKMRQEYYWLKQFEGKIPVLEMPSDFDRPAVKDFEGDVIYFEIDETLTAQLNRLALETNTTLFVVLVAVYSILLARYSGQEDIVIGTTITGRPHVDLQTIIGMFVNMLPMRTFPKNNSVFKEFLENVRENTLNAFENHEYQFDELIAKLDLKRDPGRNPLFDVVLDFKAGIQEEEMPEMENPGLDIKPYSFDMGKIKTLFDLVLGAREIGGRLVFELSYLTGLYKKDTIKTMTEHFKRLINEIVKNPGVKISKIEILSSEEKENLLKGAGSRKKQPVTDNPGSDEMAVKFNF